MNHFKTVKLWDESYHVYMDSLVCLVAPHIRSLQPTHILWFCWVEWSAAVGLHSGTVGTTGGFVLIKHSCNIVFFTGCWRQLYWSAGILHGSLSHNASGGDGPQSQSGGGSERAGCWHADILPLQKGPAGWTVLRAADQRVDASVNGPRLDLIDLGHMKWAAFEKSKNEQYYDTTEDC